MRPRFALFLFLFAVVVPALIRAQTVRWDPPRGSIPVGQTIGLRLVYEDCTPRGEPTLPRVPDLKAELASQNSNTSIINGAVSSSVVLTYAVTLAQSRPVDIPAFTVETDKGQIQVAAARYEPTAATVGGTATQLSDAASARITLTPNSVWAGEVFDLTANVEAASSFYPQFSRGFDWLAEPLIAETWSDPPQRADVLISGQQHTGYSYKTRAIARSPGRFNLNAATHTVSLSVGVSGFGFFQQRQYDQYTITSNTPTLEVKALPAPPAGFGGAVGQFQLVSKVVPEKAAVGEPITWTLELSGTGNWPDIPGLPSRNVSNDFNVVQPKAKRTPADGKIFDVTVSEDVVLVPTKPGSYTLGPVNFSYFDPKSGSYKTVSAPRTTIAIAAPAASQFQVGLQPPIGGPATEVAAPERKGEPPAIPAPPANLPRDPLTGSDVAATPLSQGKVVLALATPFAGLVLFWLYLAVGLARKTDPLRAQREARIRLSSTLAKLGGATTDADRAALIIAWQHDTAILWELAHAAPPATALPDPAWSTLWAESDRALYGAQAALPADWVARGSAALAAKRVPGFRPLRLFLPRNLFPFAALIACGLFALATLQAADGGVQYRAGDFAGAEKTWREAVAAQPTDWIARHNLSLALAQQERDGESAAQAAAAFVQNPGDAPSFAQFVFSGEKAGFAAPELASFLSGTARHGLARQASPATWQRLLIAAAFGAALALGWLLANAYGARRARHRMIALGLFGLCLVLGAISAVGWTAYGIAADTRAVIVWRASTLRSIPTEADTTQKTSPLAAGSLAIVDKTFVNDRWQHLVFENGQTGWTRKDDVVPLWK